LLASAALLAQDQPEPPLPAPLPGSRLIDTRTIDEPLELAPGTSEAEAVIAGQRYLQYTYARPANLTAIAFVHGVRDALFAAGWKLISVTRLDQIPMQPETVHVAAHYRDHGRNVYVRYTLEPGKPYRIYVADIDTEDWAAQLAAVKELESEPTLRKLAGLINAPATPAVRLEGYMDNIGEAGRAERQTLSLGRARMVVSWLTTQGNVPANKVAAQGLGHSRPVADNDTDLGRALNRRIEVARTDCTR
jgi:outer membrane protein OmpA-like peptidoglycan-associated protein